MQLNEPIKVPDVNNTLNICSQLTLNYFQQTKRGTFTQYYLKGTWTKGCCVCVAHWTELKRREDTSEEGKHEVLLMLRGLGIEGAGQ